MMYCLVVYKFRDGGRMYVIIFGLFLCENIGGNERCGSYCKRNVMVQVCVDIVRGYIISGVYVCWI